MAFDDTAAPATQVASSNGTSATGNTYAPRGVVVVEADAQGSHGDWVQITDVAPDWEKMLRGEVGALCSVDREWFEALEQGAVTSAARCARIKEWRDHPEERLELHTAAATKLIKERQQRWRATATQRLTPAHRQLVLKRGFSEAQVRWMFETGLIRSLSWQQVEADWLDMFPKARETRTGGLLLCFDPQNKKPDLRTFSLRCDVAPVEKRITGDRPAKYLYAAGQRDPLSGEFSDDKGNPLNNQQPFVPNGMMGPDGQRFGNAEIATEGLFDALTCTLLLGIPCVGLTAPGHMRGSALPKGLRLYIGDADQWLAPGLLPTVVGQCCSKGLNLARLPLRAGHDYTVKPSDLHPDAKAGMEELLHDLGADAARKTVLALAATAGTPGDYLDWEIQQLKDLGLRWPEHEPAISSIISAAADAHRSSQVGRDALIERIHAAFGVGKRAIAAGIKTRLERIEEKRNEEKRLARQIQQSEALARGDIAEPHINPVKPTNKQLQEWVAFQHELRFNELTGWVERDNYPITEPKMAYQLLAQIHGIECRKEQAIDVLTYVALQNPYNPVAEYLLRIKGDDTIEPITSRELAQLMGIAQGDNLSIELLWRSLAGTVLRGLTPGAKFDQCPILHGIQGLYKSAAIEALAGADWYDVLGDQKDLSLDSWAVAAKMNRCWLLELGEVGRLTRGKHADEFKVWLSSSNSRYAEKNEQKATDHPKRAVPWGTTNDEQLLNDPTGTRRFWIIHIAHEADYNGIPAHRDRIWRTVQLWMERGLTTWLDRKDTRQRETLAAAAARGEAATFDDPWAAVLMNHCEELIRDHQIKLGAGAGGRERTYYGPPSVLEYTNVGGRELLFASNNGLLDALDIDKGRRSKGDAMRASAVMKLPAFANRGWTPHRTITQRGYIWAPEAGPAADTSTAEQASAGTETGAQGAQGAGVMGSGGQQMPWYDWDLLPAAAADEGP